MVCGPCFENSCRNHVSNFLFLGLYSLYIKDYEDRENTTVENLYITAEEGLKMK